jgi:hypothetical protein
MNYTDPNCINFSVQQAEKLMQFGRETRKQG